LKSVKVTSLFGSESIFNCLFLWFYHNKNDKNVCSIKLMYFKLDNFSFLFFFLNKSVFASADIGCALWCWLFWVSSLTKVHFLELFLIEKHTISQPSLVKFPDYWRMLSPSTMINA
jgi:hypothetical protein